MTKETIIQIDGRRFLTDKGRVFEEYYDTGADGYEYGEPKYREITTDFSE